ncbi:MAG: NAD(P)/FAD-dependent oxidoreductase [Deltaproteobacteria bacterium]
MKNVIVTGAGPAGLFAGIFAQENRAKVTILEKMDRPARKLMITGKGRCNLTNIAELQDFIQNIPGNGVFLYSALHKFDNQRLIEFLNDIGVSTKVERGGRVFPQSDSAVDTANAIISYVKKKNIELSCNAECEKLIIENKCIQAVQLKDGRVYECDALILATGGMSYPKTGSTGDGYKLAKEAGHTIIQPKPSLVPLVAKEKWIAELMGLSLKNVSIKLVYKGKNILYEDFGEMLFTHFGVSGPIIISSSRHILDLFYFKDKKMEVGDDLKLFIDYKPALIFEKLDERIQRDFIKYSNKEFKNSLDDLLPKKLIPVIVRLSEINPDKVVNQISKVERLRLVNLLKNFELTITGFRPIDEAIITAGGIAANEINPSTMESKLVKGLYFAGEIIDVDGYTGGYNLQIAFSTGYTAGISCVK